MLNMYHAVSFVVAWLMKNEKAVDRIHADCIRAIIRIRPLITDTQTNILDW